MATLSPAERMRQFTRGGAFPTSGAPRIDGDAGHPEEQAPAPTSAPEAPVPSVAPPRLMPGSFSRAPAPIANPVVSVADQAPSSGTAPALSPADRLRQVSQQESNTSSIRREMAAMKTLTRLLEAVFTRPGSMATDEERMVALGELSSKTFDLGTVVARIAGDDADRRTYVRAMAMDAAVGLVCRAWEQNREIDWEKLIEASASIPEVDRAAQEMAQAAYRQVQTQQDASERLAVSMHAAFWQVYELGGSVDGIDPRVAAEIVRDCANYLQDRDKFVMETDLYVSWLQGSIRRMTDLVCAEMRARFGNGQTPTQDDIASVLAVSRSGFEGVENYAQSILEKSITSPVSRPANR